MRIIEYIYNTLYKVHMCTLCMVLTIRGNFGLQMQWIWWELQKNQAILRVLLIVTWRTTCRWCVATHFLCLMGAYTRLGKSRTHTMHWDAFHPSLRAPKLWIQRIWWEPQKYQAILRVMYIVRWRITGHRCVSTHSPYIVGAWERSDKSGTQSMYYDHVHPSLRAHKMWNQRIW